MSPQAIMIYAAGLGTRMGPLTKERPKPLIEVAGKALIDHAFALTDAVRPLRHVVNVHYHADQIRDHLAAHYPSRDIALSDETDRLLETGGGLKHAAPYLGDGPVFTLNTDALWRGPNPLAALRAAWRPEVMDGLVLLVRRENVVGHEGRGDFQVDAQGRIARGPGHVYPGAQIVRQEAFRAEPQAAFSTNLIWDRMIAEGRLFGLLYEGRFADVGRPDAIAPAEAMVAGDGDV